MSMCNCNQGRLPCTCKPIEGEIIMSEVKRYDPAMDAQEIYQLEGDVVSGSDFDRVTAECKALQERLNAADQKDDDLSFQLKDREGSRRDWLQAAKAAEKRVEALEGLLRRAVDSGILACYRYEELEADFCAALSASAEPSAQCTDGGMCEDSSHKCSGCAPVERDLDDDPFFVQQAEPNSAAPKVECGERPRFNAWLSEVTHEENTDNGVLKVQRHQELSVSDEQIAWDAWQARAALDCPDCGDTGLEPCSKHGWKP